jgi:hypothetical protein
LIADHLVRDGVIGDEQGCVGKTLIDYTMEMLPRALTEIKKQEVQISQSNFIIKNFTAKMTKAVFTDIPNDFKRVEKEAKKRDQNFDKFEKYMTSRFN